MHESILLIEDEQGLRTTLCDRLRDEGYTVETAEDGEQGLGKASNSAYDLIILDLMLPRLNGLDVCRELRKRGIGTAILMLTVRSETLDKVVGLRLGADDYMTKPFDAAELLARINARLRRLVDRPAYEGQYQFGSIRVDLKISQVTRHGNTVKLTGREFRLLCYLVEHAGTIIPREELLRAVWGCEDNGFSRTVNAHVRTLRQKLEDNPHRPSLILTISGVGYKLVNPTNR